MLLVIWCVVLRLWCRAFVMDAMLLNKWINIFKQSSALSLSQPVEARTKINDQDLDND